MLQKLFLTCLGLLFLGNITLAQRTWTLEQCINHVEASNTASMRYANLEVAKRKAEEEKQKAALQPDLGFGTDIGLNLGRSVDPSTNAFNTEAVGYNSLSLESSYTLYDGNQTKNAIKRSKLEVQAAEKDALQLARDISLEVVQGYLRILMAEENLSNAKKNLERTQEWLRQTKKLVEAGIRARSDLRNIEIQIAKDKQNIVEQRNFVERSYNALKQLLELDPAKPLKIEKPTRIPSPEAEPKKSFSKIFAKALSSQPGIEAGELRLESIKLDKEIARRSKAPTLSVFGGLYTNYSTATKDFTKPDSSNAFAFQNELLDVKTEPSNETIDLFWNTTEGITFPTSSYFNQITSNLGFGFGVRLYVPILDQKASKLNQEIAQLNYQQLQESNLQVEQQLRGNIQNALVDVQAAMEKLEAMKTTFDLLEKTLVALQKRLKAGNLNPFEYKQMVNERDSAEIDLVIAKYEYALKKMIVDFYEGKRLSLRN